MNITLQNVTLLQAVTNIIHQSEEDDSDANSEKDEDEGSDNAHNVTHDSGGTAESNLSGSGQGTIVTVIDRQEQQALLQELAQEKQSPVHQSPLKQSPVHQSPVKQSPVHLSTQSPVHLSTQSPVQKETAEDTTSNAVRSKRSAGEEDGESDWDSEVKFDFFLIKKNKS